MTATAETLFIRAGLWHWTARAFWYPDESLLADLAADATWRDLAHMGSGTGSPEVVKALRSLRRAANALSGATLRLVEEHTFLFARQVLASPNGTAYAAALGADRAHELAKISAFYAAFGFEKSDARRELADHVCLEFEFVAALLAKETYALSQGWQDRAVLAQTARRRFLEEHLERWLPLFAKRLKQHARLAFYPKAGELGLALLAVETLAAPPAGSRRV